MEDARIVTKGKEIGMEGSQVLDWPLRINLS